LAQNNGIEVPLLYGVAAVALGLTGFGAHSLDVALGLNGLWTPALTWGALAVGALGGVANAGLRRPLATAHARERVPRCQDARVPGCEGC
jgi:hypothetical protein